MPPGPYCTLVRRYPGVEPLIAAELGRAYGARRAETGVYLSPSPVPWAETAFGIAGGRQIAAASTLDELALQVRALKLQPESFGIVAYRIPQKAKGSSAAKKAVADVIDGGAVDTDSPALSLGLLISPAGFRLFERSSGGNASWVRAETRPNNLPVSIGVRFAKAMLNLTTDGSRRTSVYDPFAGSGTIPLVAALSGHEAVGSDIAYKAVKLARDNARAIEAEVDFAQHDARTTVQRADCIVGNLPYGAFCHLSVAGIDGVLANLKTLAARITLVTSEDIRNRLVAHGYIIDSVIEVEPERFRRFVFVTRVSPGDA